MAAYFNKNIRILRRALEKKHGRKLEFDYIAVLLGFPSIKLERWERDGEPNLAELRKLAEAYSRALGMEITVDKLYNRDLRYDPRFADVAWKTT